MAVPQIIPISELRKRQAEVVSSLGERPVILTQHGYGAAVLLSLSQWEELVDRLDDLESTVAALKAELALSTGEDELEEWEPEAAGVAD